MANIGLLYLMVKCIIILSGLTYIILIIVKDIFKNLDDVSFSKVRSLVLNTLLISGLIMIFLWLSVEIQ